MAAKAALELYVGTNNTLEITLDPTANATGWEGWFIVRTWPDDHDGEELIRVAFDVANGPGGVLSVPLGAVVSDIEPGRYFFQVVRTVPNDLVLTDGEVWARPNFAAL